MDSSRACLMSLLAIGSRVNPRPTLPTSHAYAQRPLASVALGCPHSQKGGGCIPARHQLLTQHFQPAFPVLFLLDRITDRAHIIETGTDSSQNRGAAEKESLVRTVGLLQGYGQGKRLRCRPFPCQPHPGYEP